MGAVSAADDVSMDAVDASVDDAITVDASIDDTKDSTAVEKTPVDAISDDAAIEEIDEETQTDEISEESAIEDSEPTRGTQVNAKDWNKLYYYATPSGTDYDIKLTGTSYTIGSPIIFGNNANIIGTSSSYITGGSSNIIPFQSTGSLNITFTNVTFRNINASILLKLVTTGTNRFINCSFDNVHTYAFQSSVIWNNGGWMTLTGCNFTNCNDSFGVITNHLTYDSVFMNIENCRFENNYGRYEPGAINNCGIMNVTDSTFINNRAYQWAGAIHTHSNAYSRIVGSNFTDNVAGTNGGALFSYSKLEVINCTFDSNNATNNGGAICGYSYGSIYNITVCSSKFINNRVINGAGGAIRAMNLGYLTVCGSNFTNNHASNGQAISAITETIDYCNCWNCTCEDCPHCENCTHYISNESANVKLCNNTYINHTGSGDTVTISGNDYIFDYNIFINSVQSVIFNGTGNIYNGIPASPNNPENPILKSNLGATMLNDDGSPTELYINISREGTTDDDDEPIVSGADWENAYGGIWAYYNALYAIADDGVIYVASGTYSNFLGTNQKNYTIIGQNNTIFSQSLWTEQSYDGVIHTYVNLIFEKTIKIETPAGIGKRFFKNCTFRPDAIIIGETSEENFNHNPVDYGYDLTVFEDCIFENYNNVIDIHKYENVEFKNCTFRNIEADSLVYTNSEYEGAVKFDACTFEGCTFNGVAKYINDIENLISIEDCNYDFEVSTDVIPIGGAFYVNSTQSRAGSKLTMDVDGDNLVISLTDMEGNPIADVDEINVLVNEESIPCQMENGVATLNISDLSGKVTFSTAFEGNANYKESSASLSTYIIVNNITVEVPVEVPVYINQTATSITASDITTTAKVAKTLSITLKDASGKVLASKAVQVTVNGKTSTVTTDKNGVAKVNVNYANAGTYYYTLSFLGDNDYKASMKAVKVTVNKQATKATFAKKTFKVKAKTKKVTFTLKDAKGKAIKGKKITFTVNKKTYTAKTNAKGIATVKVKLTKKGKYTAVAKFAGDNTYKAISKKAKITVK